MRTPEGQSERISRIRICAPSAPDRLMGSVSSTESITPMLRTVALNGLFVLAEFSSAAAETILYKFALIAIVLLLHTLWLRAAIKRAMRAKRQRSLDSSEYTLDTILGEMTDAHLDRR